ncbi:MAG: SOS response-associated peptidase [Gammaproteobacteria bacterium]|nr:SOS response-associated peptidase [Gammaproteobacteria bacterium]MBU1443890.1 SOS response-associated peptidase [Gammaproteobacteria bacterium]MBU2287389.1 SOS response-associated peptidase [Gammaproteobacteria bacterium]MBU2408885.1 SOS response-associated peptidase [Gammaproteobacteria bacterium]
MCTRYISPETREIEAYWHIGARTRSDPFQSRRNLFPLATGPFIRASADDGVRELALGQWGMIPPDSETRIPTSRPRGPGEKPKRLSTVNARTESVNSRPTFSSAWRAGQRCIVPASSFDEPNWESGKNVWWQFRRADGAPWGVAGLWSRWTDPESGEMVDSYTMLTMKANAHPLMNRMHKPEVEPKTKVLLPSEKQDKRSLVLVECEDVDRWLQGTVDDAKALLVLTPVKLFLAGPHVVDEGAVKP